MYQRYKDRFGTAGVVIGVIALVLALTGAAFAAGGLTKSQEKQVKKLAKQEAQKYANSNPGAPGVAGTNGTNGTNGEKGAKGDNGTNGTNGTDGADGESVTEDVTLNCGAAGGVAYTLDGTTTDVCNGEDGADGSPWTAGGTLPVGSTETGAWAVQTKTVSGSTAISFNVPLAAGLDAAHTHIYSEAGFATTCTGTAAAPTAPSGNLCIYKGIGILITSASVANPTSGTATTTPAGTVIGASFSSENGFVYGTWAVTG